MDASEYLEQRQQVIDACLALARRGYLAGTGGNVALRVEDQLLAVTPTGTDYYAMEPMDIALVRLDTLAQVGGRLAPSVETGLHAAMLRSRPEARASVHTHQPIASALSLLDLEFPVEDEADRQCLGPVVGRVGYAPSGTRWLVRALRQRLRPEVQAYVLRNHGLICRGRDLPQACELVARVEQLAARLLAQRVETLPPGSGLRRLARETLAAAAA